MLRQTFTVVNMQNVNAVKNLGPANPGKGPNHHFSKSGQFIFFSKNEKIETQKLANAKTKKMKHKNAQM